MAAVHWSILVAGGATALLVGPGVWLGWILARRAFVGKLLLELVLMLPLVLPPTAIGGGLILLFGKNGALGGWHVLFSWKAMMISSALAGLPLLVSMAHLTFVQVDSKLEAAARTLGCSSTQTFLRITLPLAWRGLLAGIALCFARALGEFGATYMVSMNSPGQRTLSLEILHLAQTPGDHGSALAILMGISIALSAITLLPALYLLHTQRRSA